MDQIYYNAAHVGGFGGVKRLQQGAHQADRRVTQNWLRQQRTYTLHRPARKRYNTRVYKTGGIDQQWQADLVEMIPYANVNAGYKYLLTVIDLFSRYGWAVPLKDKTGKEVTSAFQQIFTQGRKPQRLQTDDGKEFNNRLLQHLLNVENIKFFTLQSQFKAAICERFNRTLKAKMWRYFTHTGRYQWTRVLPEILQSYNNAVHRSIGMAPSNVNAENEHELWLQQEQNKPQIVTQRDIKTVFRVGDSVRISIAKAIFDKGYLPNWSEEIYMVTQILKTDPVQYKIQDYGGEELKGSFYAAELQAVAQPERYAVERVIRTRKVGRRRRQYFVKWLGYGPEFNSWTDDIGNIE
jgi:transposase InsO family protein